MKKGRTVLLRRSTRSVGGNTGGGPSQRSKCQRAILKISNKCGDDDGGNCCNDSIYKLKWNLQSQQLLKELANIYGHDEHCEGPRETDGTDVTLFNSGGGGCISAHRIVLMMCSPYFRKLFAEVSKSRRKGNDNAVVILGNVSTAAQLHNLVRFIYTGEVDLSTEIELDEFSKIVQQFGLEGVSPSTTSSAPTVEVTPQKRNKTTPNKGEVEEIICKNEPSDDVYTKDDDGGGGDESDFTMEDGGDDEASNFSDDFRDNLISSDDNENDDDLVKDPDVSFDGGSSARIKKVRKKYSKRSSTQDEDYEDPRLDHRTGKFRRWTRIDVPSEEELAKGWRTKDTTRYVKSTSRRYYCRYGGKKCPAEIKIKTLPDGTKVGFKNACEHDYHQGLNYHCGLTQDQKQFVIDCLQAGVTQPSNILLKFDMSTSGIPKPQLLKLRNMLAKYKKQCPEYWKNKEPSKWPKRIRKKPEKGGPPKKRGRPSATLSAGTSDLSSDSHRPTPVAPTNTATSSLSSSPPVPVSSSSLANFPAHPNHFMGQTSFSLNSNIPSITTVIPPPPLYPFDNDNFR